MAISSAGIGSGLDVNGIITKLMNVESQPLKLLDAKEAGFQGKLTALGSLKGALSTFQGTMSGLSALSRFQSVTTTPADATVLTASADSTATAGSYAVDVTTIAQSQSIYAAGKLDTTSAIGAGGTTTLTFKLGTITGTPVSGIYPDGSGFAQDATQATGTVTIDFTNNSLQGIRDAINKANFGVTATIVNDGSASPYRLVLTSTKTGATSGMNITVAGDATLQGMLGYDVSLAADQHMTQSAAARNATFTVNGVSITSASNTVTTAIPGVTLNLLKNASSTTLTVARDTASVQAAVGSFVSSYNTLQKTLADLTSYDPKTKQAGPLLGDFTAQTIQSQLRRMMNTSITGLSGSVTTLSQIGISFQKDGTLALDSTKLGSAISSNLTGVAGLFASIGTTTDSLVSFTGSTSKTQPGKYALNVSSLATQGKAVGESAAGLVIDATNNSLNININGTLATVTLANATYLTAADLATQVQTAINSTSAFNSAGITASVSADGLGKLTITSDSYGAASSVFVAGSGLVNLMGSQINTAGSDVAGFIDGNTAVGSGQYLTGQTGTSAEGLQLKITGGLTGDRGSINFSRGYAYNLNALATDFLSSTGAIASRTDGINSDIKYISTQREQVNRRLTDLEATYRKKFTSLDTLIASMNQTQSFLTQQLASLSKLSSGGN